MQTIKVQVYHNTAFTEDPPLAATGENPEEAVKTLLRKIREVQPGTPVELPYLGAKFTPRWEDLKRFEDIERRARKEAADEFEASQKVPYRVSREAV